jgi:hypothetical protein
MELPSPLYTGPRKITSIEVEEAVLQRFRMAISKKHRGCIKGFTYIELNNALSAWTRVMSGEAEVVDLKKTPMFGGGEKKV